MLHCRVPHPLLFKGPELNTHIAAFNNDNTDIMGLLYFWLS